MENINGFIVLVDVSGYTKFVRTHNSKKVPVFGKIVSKQSEEHAEHIISDLLERVIEELEGTLTVNKLEGDAVLFFSNPEELNEYPKVLLEKILSSFEVFTKRLSDIMFCEGTCVCDACHQMGNLKLKSFIHYGDFVLKKVNRFEEIAGGNVILAHRLMKNSIASSEYILFTKSVQEVCDLTHLGKIENRTEKCDDLGNIPVGVFYPNNEPQLSAEKSLFSKLIAKVKYFRVKKKRTSLIQKFISAA